MASERPSDLFNQRKESSEQLDDVTLAYAMSPARARALSAFLYPAEAPPGLPVIGARKIQQCGYTMVT